MTGKATYFRLGIFILLAAGACIALAVVLGAGALFRKDLLLESYFSESVQGVEVGAKVLFRGVMVGNVTRLTFTYVKYQLDRPPNQRKPYVLIEFFIRPQLIGAIDVNKDELIRVIRGEVEKGLRVRQVPQGVTGLSYLELDYADPKKHPPLPFDWEPEYVYVPSSLSAVSRIVSGAEELFRRLSGVDVEAFVTNVNLLAATLSRKAEELDLARLSNEVVALASELRQTNQRVQKILATPAWDAVPRDAAAAAGDAAVAAARLRKLAESDDFPKVLNQLTQTLNRIDRILAGRENDIAVTLNNLRQMTDNLRDLSENAKRYPSGVIFGEPPKKDQRAR